MLARERVEREGLKNVDYVTGDAVTLPLESNSIDVAFLVSVLGEVEQPQVALREILRVLRPGGTLSLTERQYRRITRGHDPALYLAPGSVAAANVPPELLRPPDTYSH